MVTFHPAYILRQTGGEMNAVKRLVWDDLKAVRRGSTNSEASRRRRRAGDAESKSRPAEPSFGNDARASARRSGCATCRAAPACRCGRVRATPRAEALSAWSSSIAPPPKSCSATSATVTRLPKELRAALARARLCVRRGRAGDVQRSYDEQTTKGLFRLHDGNEVEAVLMEHHGDRKTVCISTQAGCAYTCAFCSTGQAGFTRNLTAAEIFDQALVLRARARTRGKRITNIVFMGMGEPFHNYDAVMDAVALLNDPHGFGLGHRHITISTVGLVRKIDRFGERGRASESRDLAARADRRGAFAIMPVNRRYPVAELMAACERYIDKTNRKVFFEYVMLDGVNDDDASARRARRADARPALSRQPDPVQHHARRVRSPATADERIWAFAAILDEAGVPVTVRQNMGRDIAAACGQLRAETQPKAHNAVSS